MEPPPTSNQGDDVASDVLRTALSTSVRQAKALTDAAQSIIASLLAHYPQEQIDRERRHMGWNEAPIEPSSAEQLPRARREEETDPPKLSIAKCLGGSPAIGLPVPIPTIAKTTTLTVIVGPLDAGAMALVGDLIRHTNFPRPGPISAIVSTEPIAAMLRQQLPPESDIRTGEWTNDYLQPPEGGAHKVLRLVVVDVGTLQHLGETDRLRALLAITGIFGFVVLLSDGPLDLVPALLPPVDRTFIMRDWRGSRWRGRRVALYTCHCSSALFGRDFQRFEDLLDAAPDPAHDVDYLVVNRQLKPHTKNGTYEFRLFRYVPVAHPTGNVVVVSPLRK